MELRALAVVALGAALGGAARFVVAQAVIARFGVSQAYFATAFVNVTGCFAIGAVLEAALGRGHLGPTLRLFLTAGVLGGYTTFSTFGFEAFALATQGRLPLAAAYVVGSVTLGLAAVAAGIATARTL